MAEQWSVADRRFLIDAPHAGSPERGFGRGRDAVTGAEVLVTVSGLQERGAEPLRAMLAPDVPGMARLLHVGPLDGEPEGLWAMVEELPAGEPVGERRGAPLSVGEVAHLVAQVGHTLRRAHLQGRAVIGLRPELVFATPDGVVTGVAPRCEPFLATATRPCTGQIPPFQRVYLAPEMISLRPVGAEADVFSLCAVAAAWATGVHPFEESSLMKHALAIAAGAARQLPAPWDTVLAPGLARDPKDRPRLDHLLLVLDRLGRGA